MYISFLEYLSLVYSKNQLTLFRNGIIIKIDSELELKNERGYKMNIKIELL